MRRMAARTRRRACPTGVLANSELLYNTTVYWRPIEVFVKRFVTYGRATFGGNRLLSFLH